VRLTTFTDYSLRVLLYTAAEPAGRATIADIAKAFGISRNHLMKVVHNLGRLGVLANTRGRNGGVRLARDAAGINIGEVVRAVERSDLAAECFQSDANTCPLKGVCRLEHTLREAVEAFYRVLDGCTLADLVANRPVLVAVLRRSLDAASYCAVLASPAPGRS
jgi:Rrf2 family nitric oxide-sensitive transcriptional repressor